MRLASVPFPLVLIVLLIHFNDGVGQNKSVDSLKALLQSSSSEKDQLKLNITLSEKVFSDDIMLSLKYAEQAVAIADRGEMDLVSMKAYLQLGNIYLQLGNYPIALKFYHKVIQEGERIQSSNQLISAYGNMGNIYYFQKDLENARIYYQKASEMFEDTIPDSDIKALSRKASLLNNLGIIYEETKNLELAEKYYADALLHAIKGKDTIGMANTINNQGTVFRDRGNIEEAFKHYQRAMDLRIKNKNQIGIVRSNHNLGEFYYNQLKDYKLAEAYLKVAIESGTKIKSWQTVNSSSELLYKVYRDQKKFKEAFETLEFHLQINDSLFSEEASKKIAQLEMQFDFDKEQSLQKAEQKQRELYFWMGAGGLLFLLIIVTQLYFLQKSKTRRSQLEQAHLELEKTNLKNDLAIKDKELATNIMYLINKNQLINEISEKLLEVKHSMNDDVNQSAIQRILLELQSNLQPELWNEFEYRFQQVHEQFYNSLNDQFPDLSPSERRLCAFLKLNMTTKEISAITHQNAKSIDVARTRLRKKLDLTGTDQNLVTFLELLGNRQN